MLLGDITWETSYGLPGEGQPPRVVAHITFDWPTWSQTSYRRWYVEEELDAPPVIEMEIVLRIQRLAEQPDPRAVFAALPDHSPPIGAERLERAGLTVEIGHPDPNDPAAAAAAEYAVEITYEGLYELVEETLADGSSSILDDHFGVLGVWIASTLVKLGDLRLAFCLPTTSRQNDPMTQAPVLLESSDGIATVTLNRTEVRNALSSEVLAALPSLMRMAEADDDVSVIVLTGADPACCAGLDLQELVPLGSTRAPVVGQKPSRSQRRRGPFPRLTKPLIARSTVSPSRRVRAGAQLRTSDRQRAGQVRRHPYAGRVDAGLGPHCAPPPGDRCSPGPRMSFTGNFMSAHEALDEDCQSRRAAPRTDPVHTIDRRDIVDNEFAAVRQIRQTYA